MRGWIKLDDGMPEHPKIAGLDGRSAWAFICSLAYSSRNLTDGFIPSASAWNVSSHADPWEPEQRTKELVEAGLWEPVEGGYQIHDYLRYQRSKTDVLGVSSARAEAGRRGGLAKARNKQTASKGDFASQNSSRKPSHSAESKQTASKKLPEQELEQEKARTARTREGKSRPEPRPAAAAYQPFQNGTQPPRNVELGLAAIHDILTAGE